MSVALIKRDDRSNPIKSAIELCNGFSELKPDHRVLIKPNLVMGADKKIIPPFGKVTTASAIEHLIQALFPIFAHTYLFHLKQNNPVHK